MNRELLNPLNALEASLDALVRSLTTTQTYAAGPKAARDLVKADDDLQTALIRLKRHQENFLELQKLRAEADSLNAKLKETVLTAVNLRKELGDIHPNILEDSDEEGEETNPVDYEELLAFATRIGKHNAQAAQEAEKLVQQQYLTAKKNRNLDKVGESQTLQNGSYISGTTDPAVLINTDDSQPSSQAQQTQQVHEAISEFQNRRTWDRAQITTPFPNGEILRTGELGKLQIQKEQNGENYADGYLELLIKQSELGYQAPQTRPQIPSDSDEPKETQEPDATVNTVPTDRRPQERRQEPRSKKALNLDFPGDDDDDDDDDSDAD